MAAPAGGLDAEQIVRGTAVGLADVALAPAGFQRGLGDLIDHHRIANFETAGPLCYRAEPVGCTATILYKMFRERGFEIKPEIAGLMLSAIISDSLLFKSPTCTQQDVKAAEELKDIAKVDIQKYGLDMLKAGASTTDKSVEFLLNMDAKSFTMGDYVTRIAQVNAVDLDEVLNRKGSTKPG
ncbi:DHH family phosphoesterase [Klebsiella pneumoniae]|nr:DHH family phosphoesterase [Klebsiella pneumoniae]